jgi:biopolymer transport protein ExbD
METSIVKLVACMLLTILFFSPVKAVTNAEIEALEKQLEQQESEEKKHLQELQAEDERKREVENQRIKNSKKEKRLAEKEKQQQEEKRREEASRFAEQEQLRKQKQEQEEEKKKYVLYIAEAEQALVAKDKELAIKKYNEAVKLYPGDIVATLGIETAKKLKHKLCYEVLGKWNWSKAVGREYIVLHDNGVLEYQAHMKGSGHWECISPETRTIKINLSMAGFSNEWLSTYSEDGKCLLGPKAWGERSCYYRPVNESSRTNKLDAEPNDICSKIIGVWRWDDMARTITRFYVDGKVVSKNILKSEGKWECINAQNRTFTMSTWNNKRDVKMSISMDEIESTNALFGTKIVARKISSNPEENIKSAKPSHLP